MLYDLICDVCGSNDIVETREAMSAELAESY